METREPGLSADARQSGRYDIEIWSADGQTLKFKGSAKNGTASVGLESLLNVGFRASTQITAWYLGLISNSGFVQLAAADTLASHAGWSELTTYSSATRPQWTPLAAAATSSGVTTVANSTVVSFTLSGTGSVRGVFLASASDKGGTTGTLYSHAVLDAGATAFTDGDVLKVTYNNRLTAA
jgi:hypothetical protein